MGKAIVTDKGISRHFGIRRQDQNLDCGLRVRAGAIEEKRLALTRSVYTILNLLGVSTYENISLYLVFTKRIYTV